MAAATESERGSVASDGENHSSPPDPCLTPWKFDQFGKLLQLPADCEQWAFDPAAPVTEKWIDTTSMVQPGVEGESVHRLR